MQAITLCNQHSLSVVSISEVFIQTLITALSGTSKKRTTKIFLTWTSNQMDCERYLEMMGS